MMCPPADIMSLDVSFDYNVKFVTLAKNYYLMSNQPITTCSISCALCLCAGNIKQESMFSFAHISERSQICLQQSFSRESCCKFDHNLM